MRILHVDTATEWRGGQRQLELLHQGLAARGHTQWVAAPSTGALASRLRVAPIHAGNDPRSVLRLARLVRRLGPDVVAAHTSHAHGLLVASGIRPIVHRRVDFATRANLKYRRAGGFIAVSRAVAEILIAGGTEPDRVVVVHDGVEPLPKAEPADLGDGPIVLAIGALVDHKDHRTLAAAAVGLEARVLVAGEGPLRVELEGSALELLGQRDDVPALLARADVFVHCSKEEGMGQVVAEAMGTGVPVVATRAGGVPEVVGDCGLLVPVGDAASLRAAIERALAGQAPGGGAERARQFTVERMVIGTEQAYARLTGALH